MLKKNLQVINLCSVPNAPSIFDVERRKLRITILFLHEFVKEISQSIEKDGHEHIDYVPTQVLTEYFRYVLPEIIKCEIEGVIYPSSKDKRKSCCVLFFDNEECNKVFELLPSDIESRTIQSKSKISSKV